MFACSLAVLRAIEVSDLCCSRCGGISGGVIYESLKAALVSFGKVLLTSLSLSFLGDELVNKLGQWDANAVDCRRGASPEVYK
jgi:hypothetical protein